MQPTTSLGLAELTESEMEQLVGGDDACWCSGLVRALGYAIGYALGEIVDALVSPEDSNSFLGK
jgi:natural product precursor